MKSNNLLIILLLITINSMGQSFIGFQTDNYSGVNSVISNPANIVDSRFKTDINLIGVSAFAGNDYYGLNIFDALKDDYDFSAEINEMPSDDNNFGFNLDILGPSFMLNIDENNSIAIFTRVRSFINASEFNGETIELFEEEDELDENQDYFINEEDLNVTTQAWAEIGVSYARVIFNEKEHFLKGGLSLKYLKGLSSGYAKGTGINIDYDADGTALPGGQTTGSLEAEGNLIYAYSDDFEDDDEDFELPDASGFGVDLGFVYEWRPDYKNYDANSSKDKNKYKLKLGLSITDIGSIKYNEGTLFDYTLNPVTISEEDIENVEDLDDLDDLLDNFYTLNREENSFKTKLPTALHLNADWNFKKNLYVNLNTDISFISKKSEGGSRISNVVSLIPRYESKWFSFYVPLSVVENSGFQAGAGLRAGPLYIGSGSIFTALASDNTKAADVYAGIKIPIYQGSPKDKDNDGIINRLDKCPNEAGPKENNGCPWGDKDGDGVLDDVDNCIDEAGSKENKGCPVIDKDKDGVIDKYDKCPEVPGVEENNGCPEDKDKDGVYDTEDECPEVAGAVENKGCPFGDKDNDGVLDNADKCPDTPGVAEREGCPNPKEIAPIEEEKLKELQSFAKAIYFNSGKTTFKLGVTGNLDLIAGIMNEYPNAVFNIEGHTDSQGSAATNRSLSDRRAKAVLNYLVSKGVSSSRISSIGYGEDYPIADNNTRDGRAQNRRVEVKLRK